MRPKYLKDTFYSSISWLNSPLIACPQCFVLTCSGRLLSLLAFAAIPATIIRDQLRAVTFAWALKSAACCGCHSRKFQEDQEMGESSGYSWAWLHFVEMLATPGKQFTWRRCEKSRRLTERLLWVRDWLRLWKSSWRASGRRGGQNSSRGPTRLASSKL